MTDKDTLRTRLRALRAETSGPPIPTAPAYLDRLAPNLVVAGYIAIGTEADPALFAAAARAAGARLALPHVTGRTAPLRFLAWTPDEPLEPGPLGLRQPAPHGTELTPDIVLTPLVGFDRRGNRLGQGAGHYDRAFAALPGAWRVGIAWGVQEVEALPCDPWDLPLDAIATEREWIAVA